VTGFGHGDAMREEVKEREGEITSDSPESRAWGSCASPCRLSLGMHIPT
jgi:hypothetical protein